MLHLTQSYIRFITGGSPIIRCEKSKHIGHEPKKCNACKHIASLEAARDALLSLQDHSAKLIEFGEVILLPDK